MQTAAIYARISADPEGRSLGVARQEQDCRALAGRLGFEVGRVFTENGVSASTNSRKARPVYDEMLGLVRAGQFSAIIAYSNSRLTRRPREVEDLIELVSRYGTRLHTVVSGDDDLSTADGRQMARIKGNIDTAEAEKTGERARRAKAQAAIAGTHRGGPRPFGWEKDGMTLRPDEAEVVARATRGVLVGRTLAAIAREINEAGVTTTTGRPWTYGALRTALCRPRNAGLVSHGRSDRPGLAIVGPAQWPAIVDEDVWRAARDVLMDPSRRLQRGNEKRWLGSGLYVCGICGGLLRVAPYKSNRTTRKWLYRCTASAHLTYSQHEADEVVLGVVRARLARSDVGLLLHQPDDGRAGALREQRGTLRARLANFEADYAAGLITGAQLAAATARVDVDVESLDRELAAVASNGALSGVVVADDPAAAFDATTLDSQRAVVDALMSVTITPSGRGRKLGPARVLIEWRG